MRQGRGGAGARPGILRESEAWLAGQAPLEASLGALIRTAIAYAGNDVRCAFYISDPAKGELCHVVGMRKSYAECVDGFRIGPDSLACGLAAHTDRPVITLDVTRERRWKPWLWLAERNVRWEPVLTRILQSQ